MTDNSEYYVDWAIAALDAIFAFGSGVEAIKDAALEDGIVATESDLCKVLEIAHRQWKR